jgi:nitrogen fixation protein NifQ
MPAPALATPSPAQHLHRELSARATGDGNDHVLACMIASWQAGTGAMPDWLGLPPAAFRCLLDHHFPGFPMDALAARAGAIESSRLEETDELMRLMLLDRTGLSPSEVWMAQVVAAGCMGADHLWQDLGLWSRADLSALMVRNFPPLAARNVKDMKWKRFLYKQLCETEGIYTCRAPSCEVCSDYRACFGPED